MSIGMAPSPTRRSALLLAMELPHALDQILRRIASDAERQERRSGRLPVVRSEVLPAGRHPGEVGPHEHGPLGRGAAAFSRSSHRRICRDVAGIAQDSRLAAKVSSEGTDEGQAAASRFCKGRRSASTFRRTNGCAVRCVPSWWIRCATGLSEYPESSIRDCDRKLSARSPGEDESMSAITYGD